MYLMVAIVTLCHSMYVNRCTSDFNQNKYHRNSTQFVQPSVVDFMILFAKLLCNTEEQQTTKNLQNRQLLASA